MPGFFGLFRRRKRNGEEARGPRRPRRPSARAWVWKCHIHVLGDDQEPCRAAFDTAPELRQHYIQQHELNPIEVSLNQRELMIRRRLPEGHGRPPPPTIKEYIRSEDFDPHWPIDPVTGKYGRWVVRGKGPASEELQAARAKRDERNPLGGARMFVPDWYADEISRRQRMRRGRTWP